MKKFYCLYNKNNLPFTWKLKQAGEKSLANFKSREDCLNYYLSLNNVGIIWFQKVNTKITSSKNVKESFDGYIKSSFKGDHLIHIIEAVPTAKPKVAKVLKRNLFHLLQIDPITGKDLLTEKGIDRIYNNKNSYLIFDNDIAEEIMSVYDSQNVRIADTNVINNSNFSSSELIRQKIKETPSNVVVPDIVISDTKDKTNLDLETKNKTKENDLFKYGENKSFSEKVAFDIEEEYKPPIILDSPQNKNFDINNQYQNYNNQFDTSNNQFDTSNNQFDTSNNQYSNEFQNQNQFQNDYYSIDTNDFNFTNDFDSELWQMQSIDQNYFNNNVQPNYFNDDKNISNNKFYKIDRKVNKKLERENKKNMKKYNTNTNDWNNQYPPRPQYNGTVEFTAVPNQMLNTELNPLGGETMIFNPYALQPMQSQYPQSQYPMQVVESPYLQPVRAQETIIQPIIQPVIQTVYQQVQAPQLPPKTTVLDPIYNAPISDGQNYPDYSQYNMPTTIIAPPQIKQQVSRDTSEFKFNNTDQIQKTSSQQMKRPMPTQGSKKEQKLKTTRTSKSTRTRVKPRSRAKLYFSIGLSLLFIAAVITILCLLFLTNIFGIQLFL